MKNRSMFFLSLAIAFLSFTVFSLMTSQERISMSIKMYHHEQAYPPVIKHASDRFAMNMAMLTYRGFEAMFSGNKTKQGVFSIEDQGKSIMDAWSINGPALVSVAAYRIFFMFMAFLMMMPSLVVVFITGRWERKIQSLHYMGTSPLTYHYSMLIMTLVMFLSISTVFLPFNIPSMIYAVMGCFLVVAMFLLIKNMGQF
jgi:hypothetical protein